MMTFQIYIQYITKNKENNNPKILNDFINYWNQSVIEDKYKDEAFMLILDITKPNIMKDINIEVAYKYFILKLNKLEQKFEEIIQKSKITYNEQSLDKQLPTIQTQINTLINTIKIQINERKNSITPHVTTRINTINNLESKNEIDIKAINNNWHYIEYALKNNIHVNQEYLDKIRSKYKELISQQDSSLTNQDSNLKIYINLYTNRLEILTKYKSNTTTTKTANTAD